MSHKNDPDYHDTRAKILLEAARRLNKLAEEKFGLSPGILEAAYELKRMASEARREHSKVLDRKRRAGRTLNPEGRYSSPMEMDADYQ